MTTARDDLLELFDYAWIRFRDRMSGLDDAEWRWQPTDDSRISLQWRLAHIAEFLREDRNEPWLGVDAATPGRPREAASDAIASAAAAMADVTDAFSHWRGLLAASTEASLARPIGAPAGPQADASRWSFAFHIVDELIHHTAEAALLRDLYAARS